MTDSYKFSKLIGDNFKNTFRFFGESEHGPTIIACSIAVFKGIFRPIFTLMDKKSDPETKKYAAMRELLTEVAAFPLYAVTPLIAGKLVDSFSKERNPLAKKRIKTNAKFFAICASTIIIPAVCNLIQPPIMAAYKKSKEAKKAQIASVNPVNQPITPSFNSKVNYGMRVGS